MANMTVKLSLSFAIFSYHQKVLKRFEQAETCVSIPKQCTNFQNKKKNPGFSSF